MTYQNAEFVNNDMALDFFDYYLLDAANGWNTTDLVTYYDLGNDVWLSSNSATIDMPLDDILYLNDNGHLSIANNGQSATSFVCDPSNPSPTIGGQTLAVGLDQGPYDQISLESRNDVITFESDLLYADATISGEVIANISVSSDQPDGDICIRLVDVHPDGRNMLINDGIRRIRFRDGYEQADESFMTPGQVYNVEVSLPFVHYTWKAGHRIKVYISGNSSNRWDVNLQDGGTMYQPGSGNIANMTIHHDQTYSSFLHLPGTNSSLSTSETNHIQVSVYPNPADDQLFIKGMENPEFALLNAQGQIILQGKGNTIVTAEIATGWYLLQVIEGGIEKQFPVIIR
jgi:hypothetical protein